MTVKEILEKRAALIADARKILDLAGEEKRDATAEEREKFDTIMDDADKLKDDADNEARLAVAEGELSQSAGRTASVETHDAGERRVFELRASVRGESRQINLPPISEEVRKQFRAFILTGQAGPELRALSKGTDSEGGFLSPPLEFMAELIAARDALIFFRQIARVLPPLRESGTLGAPTIDIEMSDPTWTTELLTGDEDTTLAFGRRDLTPNPLAKWIKVSKTLLRRSTMDVDVIVRDQLAKKFARAEENAYLNGSGSGEPLGVFIASANGISTGRDVQDDNLITGPTFDGLINAQEHVQEQYQENALWIMHRDIVKLVRKLKDDSGQYIWQPSKIVGSPDELLGKPIRRSEFAPNSLGADLYVGIYGDFSEYWIVDALTLTIQVLIELYAATNQNAYLGRLEADGAPVDELAFSRVQLASS